MTSEPAPRLSGARPARRLLAIAVAIAAALPFSSCGGEKDPFKRGEAALSTWLHAIATRVVLNGLRSVKRHEAHAEPLEAADAEEEMPEPPAAVV